MGIYIQCNGCGCHLSGRAVVINYENQTLCEECFKEKIWNLEAEQIAEKMRLDIAAADEYLPLESW